MRELGRIREFSETKDDESSFESMAERAEEILKSLEGIEDDWDSILDVDQKAIREGEKKEYDIPTSEPSTTQETIDDLKSNLGGLFGMKSNPSTQTKKEEEKSNDNNPNEVQTVQEQKNVDSGTIPREPPIESVWGHEPVVKEEIILEHEKEEIRRIREAREAREKEEAKLNNEIVGIKKEIKVTKKAIKDIETELFKTGKTSIVYQKYPDLKREEEEIDFKFRNYESDYSSAENLNDILKAVSSDLEFYKGLLSRYENFQKRFNEAAIKIEQEKVEKQQSEKEQKRIYNLIYSDRNEELKARRSMYTAWDLGDKSIPDKYKGKTYNEVKAMIEEEKAAKEKDSEPKEIKTDESKGNRDSEITESKNDYKTIVDSKNAVRPNDIQEAREKARQSRTNIMRAHEINHKFRPINSNTTIKRTIDNNRDKAKIDKEDLERRTQIEKNRLIGTITQMLDFDNRTIDPKVQAAYLSTISNMSVSELENIIKNLQARNVEEQGVTMKL